MPPLMSTAVTQLFDRMKNCALSDSVGEIDTSKHRGFARRSVVGFLGTSALLGRHSHAQSGTPGVTDRQVTLGGSIDLSGPVSTQVRAGFSGAQLFFNQLNERGGVHGRQVILKLLDDGFDPSRTVANIERLNLENNTFALFGTTGDTQSAAAIELSSRLNIPLFSPVCGDYGLRALNKPKVYFVRASYRDEARKILQHALTVGHPRLAVVFQDDGFGKSMLNEINVSAKQLNLQPPESFAISTKGGMPAATAERLMRLMPTAILLATVGEAFTQFSGNFLMQSYFKPQIYGFSLMSPLVIARDLGVKGRGIILTQFVPSIRKRSIPIVAEFLNANQISKSQSAPNTLALEGYLMAKIFAEGLRRAGRDLTRGGLVAVLDRFGSWDAGGIYIHYDQSSRAGSSYVDLAVVNETGGLVF